MLYTLSSSFAALLRSTPSRFSSVRSSFRISALSLTVSARISRAPASAVSASGTSFSASMYFAASAAGSPACCSISHRASGSRPRSLATVARVRRFGR